MDLNEWECYVQSSRLKTKRQRVRLRKWDSDKQLLKLHRELKRLGREQKNLGFKELIPPVQRGWKRTFIVRPDVARSQYGTFFQSLLEKINTEQFSSRRDFKQKRRRKGKKVHVERIQKLREPEVCSYKRLNLTDRERAYFTEVWEFYARDRYRIKYVFNEPWRYVLRVQPNLITKIKIIDPLLKQQEAEIEAFLESRNLRTRLDKLLYGRHKDRYHWNFLPNPKYQSILEARHRYEV